MLIKKIYITAVFLIAVLLSGGVSAQNPNRHIRKGNDLYEEKKYNKAETSYLKALESDSNYVKGLFNRADALYQQENYKEAGRLFEKLTRQPLSEQDQASVWHNMGNTFLKNKKYKDAIEAYKNALRNSPSDMDTKYNLSYAIEKLKDRQKKQQNKNKQNKNNKNNKEKNKDKNKEKSQDKQKQNKDQQNKQKQNKQDKQEQKQDQKQNKQQNEQNDQKKQQKPQPRKISKQDAKRMLQALKNNEKNTLKKLKRLKGKGKEIETDKDW